MFLSKEGKRAKDWFIQNMNYFSSSWYDPKT
jgi:hypothetical protein